MKNFDPELLERLSRPGPITRAYIDTIDFREDVREEAEDIRDQERLAAEGREIIRNRKSTPTPA